MKNYTVYIIECCDGTLYTGITTDVERRVRMHSEGKGARYTRARGVLRLVFTEGPFTHSAALLRERALKKLPRRKKLDMIG
jgi:putative endonuclease